MFFINKKKKETQIEETNYWLSIGDLMASILMIFMLLFIVKTIETGRELRKKEEIIESFTGLKKNIISKIQKDFEERGIKVDIDPQTGTIKIDDKILFNTGEYLLKPEGKKYLNDFVPIYINLLLNDEEVKKELSQIIIEGHTDDVGSYIYNMELSQKRAFEVIKYIYDEMPNFKGKEELKSYITANGRSNIKVLRDNSGNIDRDKSRRVEFQFEINFKKFYPVNLEKKKDEINDFWNQIFKEVRDEKIFELIEKVLRNKSLKVDEVIILLYNIKKVDEYLIRKNTELSDFIISIKFDLSEK